MNRYSRLLSTPAVTLSEFDHPPGVTHADPDVEITTNHALAYVEEGSFDVAMGKDRWVLGPGSMFLTTPGMTFSVRHDHEHPTDRCLSITFSEDAWEELRTAGVPELSPPHADVTPRRSFIRHRLTSCEPGQEMRLELLAGALAESFDAPASRRRPSHTPDLVRQIDRAVELIDVSFAQPLTLQELAGTAHMSPFHFARVFRELVGVPPHRYLMTVRLRHALRMLYDGASVSNACYDVGFASLSHFVTVFRERFGVVPSQARQSRRRALDIPRWAGR